jgi:hypothetical protein
MQSSTTLIVLQTTILFAVKENKKSTMRVLNVEEKKKKKKKKKISTFLDFNASRLHFQHSPAQVCPPTPLECRPSMRRRLRQQSSPSQFGQQDHCHSL